MSDGKNSKNRALEHYALIPTVTYPEKDSNLACPGGCGGLMVLSQEMEDSSCAATWDKRRSANHQRYSNNTNHCVQGLE